MTGSAAPLLSASPDPSLTCRLSAPPPLPVAGTTTVSGRSDQLLGLIDALRLECLLARSGQALLFARLCACGPGSNMCWVSCSTCAVSVLSRAQNMQLIAQNAPVCFCRDGILKPRGRSCSVHGVCGVRSLARPKHPKTPNLTFCKKNDVPGKNRGSRKQHWWLCQLGKVLGAVCLAVSLSLPRPPLRSTRYGPGDPVNLTESLCTRQRLVALMASSEAAAASPAASLQCTKAIQKRSAGLAGARH